MKQCVKIRYTEEEASNELRRIVEVNDYRVWKGLTPGRKYYCKYCDCYHLTSAIKLQKYSPT
jgi:hypothetical protein